MGSGILRNPRYELYCQAIASGKTNAEAMQASGFKNNHGLKKRPEVQRRIEELLKSGVKRMELSRKDILDRIYDDWELSRKLGQMAAALKAGELMGKEMHKMFVDRKEVGSPGDFDNKTEEELREIIKAGMKDLGWDDDQVIAPESNTIN